MNFVPGLKAPTHWHKAWWFLFNDGRLLVTTGGSGVELPLVHDPAEIGLTPLRSVYIGTLDDVPCYASEVDDHIATSEAAAFRGLRGLLGELSETWFRVAGLAGQILHWERTHQYCGLCGADTVSSSVERAKECTQCGEVYYPRITPAVIVAVVREDRILLAHAHRFPRAELYSVLAGFVESGESLDECVRREVLEETGIEVTNIRYFGSQPWPFPGSLMIAFTAEYAGGEIRIDASELRDAGWFSADALPKIPDRGAIARELIDWFVNRCSD